VHTDPLAPGSAKTTSSEQVAKLPSWRQKEQSAADAQLLKQ
jgi:hypothetical protein